MADTINVKGLSELNDYLQTFPVKLERNILRGALRAGMNVVKPVAQAGVNKVSGELAKGLKVGTRSKGGIVYSTLKATGKHAFVAHMIEFTGAKPHTITAKNRKGLSFGGLFFQSVNHPGFQKHPFMRPALDQQAQAAVIAAGNYIKDRLQSKEGIDTSGITVEGDEP